MKNAQSYRVDTIPMLSARGGSRRAKKRTEEERKNNKLGASPALVIKEDEEEVDIWPGPDARSYFEFKVGSLDSDWNRESDIPKPGGLELNNCLSPQGQQDGTSHWVDE